MTKPHPARDTPLQRNQRRSLAYRDVPVTLPEVPVGAARHEIVASLTDATRATFEALAENGIAETVGTICARTGACETVTRQHLATLCASGLVRCNGGWCWRTRPRSARGDRKGRDRGEKT